MSNPTEQSQQELNHVLAQMEEDRKNAVLPADVSVDFAMTEHNLYAVWSTPTNEIRMINPKTADIHLDWLLANPDDALMEISKQFPENNLLAFMSVHDLNNLVLLTPEDSLWKKITNIFGHVYFVEHNSKKYWTDKKEGVVLLEGKQSDILTVQQEGQNILNTKNYVRVFDARKVEPGHPKDWLRFMKSPSTAITQRENMLTYFGHDGSGQ